LRPDLSLQEVYYTTHSFFLTPHAIYLLVFDLSVPLENSFPRLNYWVHTLAGLDAVPVILVGTHADSKVDPSHGTFVLNACHA
jgi:GTPase SAR1 family protein